MTLALRRVQISDTISTKQKVFFIPNKFELVQVKNWHKSSEKPPPAWQKCLWRWHLGMGESLVDCYNVRSHFHFVDQMRGEGTLARARTRPHSFLHSLFSPFNLLSLIECLSLMLISVTRVIWQFRFSCRDTMNATMRMTKNDVVQKSSESLALPSGMDNMTWHLLVHED